MKTFREFVVEADSYTRPTDGSSHGGGSSVSDIDSRTDLTPEQKAKYKKFKSRSRTVSSKDAGFGGQKPQAKPQTPSSPPKSGGLVKSNPGALSTNVKPPVQKIKTNLNVPGGKFPKGLKSGSVASGVIDTALEKQRGSGWGRSLAKGTVSALGALAGGAAGSAVAPGLGTLAGGAAGSMAASQAFDTAAGANAKERAAMRQQKRQSQSGGALKGIGGKTTFDTKKGTMTTGAGSQKKTVQLGKTSVVTDPKTGKKETGYLAYKGGKAVYKRSDTSNATLAKTSSNPFERIGRTIAAGAYKKHDENIRQQKLKQASASDIKRQQALGVKGSKNLVGPKIVGPKIVGPKK